MQRDLLRLSAIGGRTLATLAMRAMPWMRIRHEVGAMTPAMVLAGILAVGVGWCPFVVPLPDSAPATPSSAAQRDTIWMGNWPPQPADPPLWKVLGETFLKDWAPVIVAAWLAARYSFSQANSIYRRTRKAEKKKQQREHAAQERARKEEMFSLSKALCDEMERINERTWKLVLRRSRGPILMDAKETCLARIVQIMPADFPIRDVLGFYENAGLIAFHQNAALALPDLWEAWGPVVLNLSGLEKMYEEENDPIRKEQIH